MSVAQRSAAPAAISTGALRRRAIRNVVLITISVVSVVAIVLIKVLAKGRTTFTPTALFDSSGVRAGPAPGLLENGALATGCPLNDSGPEWRAIRNGRELRRAPLSGLGSLKIGNGTRSDAVVKLVDTASGRVSRKIFVRAKASASLDRVAPGSYQVQYESGATYLPRKGRFCHSEGDFQFDNQVSFEEIPGAGRTEYVVYELTLHPIVGGNARTHRIRTSPAPDPDDTTAYR